MDEIGENRMKSPAARRHFKCAFLRAVFDLELRLLHSYC
jgi:hypothetical protein